MSYRVLARAYRSNTFDEVVGQEPIAATLTNAIKSGRIHHGYLFTGTRGVGKTSLARILAKALNCLSSDAPTPTPCCTCESCQAIARGEDVDVVEIDAASHTGVDNIRELRGNATLRPARSRFKVYIIDEVHMLSTGAFNALLKTLEEPPPHVKFILATTESQKVPATIQSRCQRFDFRAIDAPSIAKHLTTIAENEKIKVDDAVFRRLARLANGSMRDALSLMDMLLSYESEHLTADIVDTILPPPHDELASAVIDAVAAGDAARALAALDAALQSGRTVDRFCDHLIEHVRTLMLMRACGTETELVDVSASVRPALAEQAGKFDAPTCVYMIALLEELRRNVKFSGAARALADAAVVRLAMRRQFTDLAELLGELNRGGTAPSVGEVGASPAVDKKKNERSPGALSNTTDAPTAAGPQWARSTNPETVETGDHRISGETDPPEPTLLAEATRPSAEVLPGMGSTTQRISSEQRERATRDPLVQRVKEAFEGTIVNVAARSPIMPATSENGKRIDNATDEIASDDEME